MLLINQYVGIQAEIEVEQSITESEAYVNCYAFDYRPNSIFIGSEDKSVITDKIIKFEDTTSLSEAVCLFNSIKVAFLMNTLRNSPSEHNTIKKMVKLVEADALTHKDYEEEEIKEFIEIFSKKLTKEDVKTIIETGNMVDVYLPYIINSDL